MKELETVSANTLIATPFEPLKMLVQNLIGEGITIIGGGSKCGKSWLMLKLCLAVADGAPFFDMETEQADVLYLCLEDSFRRLQERLFKLTDNDAPENLHMAVSAGVIGNELDDQIRDFKDKHPNLRLIVVDTLQMVREQDPYLNAYADDYKCLTSLKTLAESTGLSIVLVHHLRKLGSSDPFEMLTGSTGLQGASDTMMVLKRERGSDTGVLYITGRDMEQQKLTMRFDKGSWSLLERANATFYPSGNRMDAIGAMAGHGNGTDRSNERNGDRAHSCYKAAESTSCVPPGERDRIRIPSNQGCAADYVDTDHKWTGGGEYGCVIFPVHPLHQACTSRQHPAAAEE